MHGKELAEEIQPYLTQGKGCIILNFGLYYPNRIEEDENLIYKIELDNIELPKIKINHRYPNKRYYTLTAYNGRKLFKCGVPVFYDFFEQKDIIDLRITTGIEMKYAYVCYNALFHLRLHNTKKNPVSCLTLRQEFSSQSFVFQSEKNRYNTGFWTEHYWINNTTTEFHKRIRSLSKKYVTILDREENDKKTLSFTTPIEPFAQELENIAII